MDAGQMSESGFDPLRNSLDSISSHSKPPATILSSPRLTYNLIRRSSTCLRPSRADRFEARSKPWGDTMPVKPEKSMRCASSDHSLARLKPRCLNQDKGRVHVEEDFLVCLSEYGSFSDGTRKGQGRR